MDTQLLAALSTLVAVGYVLLRYLGSTDIPKIKNLPEVPGVPVFGNLLQLGSSHPRVAASWTKKYGPVFQVRLGSRRVVFVNSYDAVKHFWVTHQSALISRPTFHTFHSVLSSSQGLTIGTSPWDESCKRRRKAAGTALNRPAVQSYMPILDLESAASIKELLQDSKNGVGELNPIYYFYRFALNISLTLNYGFRIEGNVEDKLLREIVHVERVVANLRSTSNNWQDYVPLLRLWSAQNKQAKEYRARRDAYLSVLLEELKRKIAAGTDKPCITGNILKDPEAKLNEAEIRSLCLTMVGAGIDTVPANLVLCLAYLSSEGGQAIQSRAWEKIQETYPNGEAWDRCLVEEKVPYITALVKETLRFWTVLPICLPRASIREIPYENAIIPTGTTFLMNAWAANYDPTHFRDPTTFDPERFLGDVGSGAVEGSGPLHYGFGAGSRMCIGSHLANRALYVSLIRLISAFEILPAHDPKDRPVVDALDCSANPTALTTDPKPFKVGLRPRDEAALRAWISSSEVRTREL